MKLVNRYMPDAIYIKENSLDKKCYQCLSKNISKTECFDCHNNGDPIYYIERYISRKEHTLNMAFKLSKEQVKASSFFLEHYKEKKDAFLYAICGSGKTEIMYETILYALNRGEKVLIAIPRKEIVKELYDRLIKVFPDTIISYLDGSHHKDDGELLISTVHQLIHYEDEFDLVILDEADAYPYAGNDYLKRLLHKSIKKDGVLFSMSATKKEKIKCDTFSLKRRYHNHDLVMPTMVCVKTPDIANSHEFKKIISNNKRKFIIYASSIRLSNDLAQLLSVDSLSSLNLNTRKIVEEFKNNSKHMLVSTTILERGITIPNLDVIIYDADNPVFTYQTIIQICGRVGRSFDDPTGNVYIFHKKNYIKYLLVKKYIERMNK